MWTILAPVRADKAMLGLVQWLAINLGWVYVVTVASVILFIVYVAYRWNMPLSIRSALDMLVSVLSAEVVEPAEENASDLLVQQAMAYIAGHLDDPELSPGSVARALYVSVRQVHTRFAAQDFTVASHIRAVRLAVEARVCAQAACGVVVPGMQRQPHCTPAQATGG